MYALIHKGSRLKLENEGGYTKGGYQQFLSNVTGKGSCKEMTFIELERVADALALDGYLTLNQPTDAQWRKLAALSYAKGWQGLKDKALLVFVERTAGVNLLKMLTRQSISDVITGLEKWA